MTVNREQHRRAALERAVEANRLEGLAHDPAWDDLHEARVRGELTHEEALGEMFRRVLGTPEPAP